MTSVAAWPPALGWHGHLLLAHATEAERREQLAAWFAAGLAAGHRVVYVIDPTPDAPADPLLDLLAGAATDGAGAVADGTLVVLPASQFYSDGVPQALVAAALADGRAGVWFSGQASSALTTLTTAQYRSFERFMTRLCAELPASALCQYDLTVPSDWSLLHTLDAHLGGGIRHRLLRSVGGTGRLQVAGEVDASDADLFGALLQVAGEATGGDGGPAGNDLDVDLRDLAWISAAGLHALAYGTADFCAGGGRVTLRVTPGSSVERTLRLLDLNLPAGVTVR